MGSSRGIKGRGQGHGDVPITRKLQRIGKSLFVSLPEKWVKWMQLGKGDVISLIEQTDGSIALYPQTKKEDQKRITLNIDTGESMQSVRRRITGAYVDGFDIIIVNMINNFTGRHEDVIREIIDGLFGLEIIVLTSNSITIRCLLAKALPIEVSIQRIHSLIKSMLSETISALTEGDFKAAKNIIKRNRDVKRLLFVAHRFLRSSILHPTGPLKIKPIDCGNFLRVIDRIADVSESVRKIAESVSIIEQPFPNSVLQPLLKTCVQVLNIYDWSVQALMTKGMSLANRVLDEKLEISFADLWELLLKKEGERKISAKVFSCCHRIIDNLDLIWVYSTEIAEITIDRAEEFLKRC